MDRLFIITVGHRCWCSLVNGQVSSRSSLCIVWLWWNTCQYESKISCSSIQWSTFESKRRRWTRNHRRRRRTHLEGKLHWQSLDSNQHSYVFILGTKSTNERNRSHTSHFGRFSRYWSTENYSTFIDNFGKFSTITLFNWMSRLLFSLA
jgi:hypothetical protein